MDIQNISDKKICFGCFSCVDVCPVTAISLKMDDEGFQYPKIDRELCTECGLCFNLCPVNNKVTAENKDKPIVYGAWNKDPEVLAESTSGGAFSALAKTIFADGGVVYGAKFDNVWNLKHHRVDNIEGLGVLRGSKYVQSSCEGVYRRIEEDLSNGFKVLFTGTPCQVAACNSYFAKSSYKNNLFTVDIVCHGVNSPGVFKKFVSYLENKAQDKLRRYKFRQKKIAWMVPQTEATFNSSQQITVFDMDPFISGFRKNIYLRKCCYDCVYAKTPRRGDVTIGDFWGVPKKYYNKKGVSLILINNRRGKEFFSEFKQNLITHPSDLATAIAQNPPLYKPIGLTDKISKMRSDFYSLFNEGRYNYLFGYFIYGKPFPLLRKFRYYFIFLKKKWKFS